MDMVKKLYYGIYYHVYSLGQGWLYNDSALPGGLKDVVIDQWYKRTDPSHLDCRMI